MDNAMPKKPVNLAPITAEEIIKLIKLAVKTFGEYSYHDKGPDEVMDMPAISSRLKVMQPQTVADVLAVVRELKDYGEDFVSSALVDLQNEEGFDSVFEDERISDLY